MRDDNFKKHETQTGEKTKRTANNRQGLLPLAFFIEKDARQIFSGTYGAGLSLLSFVSSPTWKSRPPGVSPATSVASLPLKAKQKATKLFFASSHSFPLLWKCPSTRSFFFSKIPEMTNIIAASMRTNGFKVWLAGYWGIEDGPVVYPANAFDSCLRGDSVPLGSSPTKSEKRSGFKLDDLFTSGTHTLGAPAGLSFTYTSLRPQFIHFTRLLDFPAGHLKHIASCLAALL